jgi:hypothetical protein
MQLPIRATGAMLAGLLLTACSNFGDLPPAPAVATAAPVAEASPPPPPPSPRTPPMPHMLHRAPPPPPAIVSVSYAGDGLLLRHQPASCPALLRVHGLETHGHDAIFGDMHGVVHPDGRLRMVKGATTLTGQFANGHFAGNWSAPRCNYTVRLNRVAS